nr:MAG TPA: hypothetical protein [Caudoviricetes sp.]
MLKTKYCIISYCIIEDVDTLTINFIILINYRRTTITKSNSRRKFTNRTIV